MGGFIGSTVAWLSGIRVLVALVSTHVLWLGFSARECVAFVSTMTHTGKSQEPGIIELSALWTLFTNSSTVSSNMALEGEHFSIGGGKAVVKRSFRAPERFQIAYVWVEVSKWNPNYSQWRPTLSDEGTASLSGDWRWKLNYNEKRPSSSVQTRIPPSSPILFKFTRINRGVWREKEPGYALQNHILGLLSSTLYGN